MNGLDPIEFFNELALIAQNDGDAYRDSKNAGSAVRQAFDEFQKRRRQEEREQFNLDYGDLVSELATRWKES